MNITVEKNITMTNVSQAEGHISKEVKEELRRKNGLLIIASIVGIGLSIFMLIFRCKKRAKEFLKNLH